MGSAKQVSEVQEGTMKSLNDRINTTLRTVLEQAGGPHFTKAEFVRKVRDTRRFADIFQ